MSTPYADLEIRILEKRDRGYPVEMTLDGKQEYSGSYLKPDFLPWTPGASPVEDGERLFGWLMSDSRAKTAWAEIRGRQASRRIRLRLAAAAPELHALPWEVLYDVDADPPQILAAGTTTPFSRYLAGTWATVQPIEARPLKLLVAVAGPQNLNDFGLAAVNTEQEVAALEEALEGLPDVSLTRLRGPATLSALEAALRDGVHLLHLIAHGAYSRRQEQTLLYLADAENQVDVVTGDTVAAMLERMTNGPRLVVLASCQTATQNPADAFRALAPALIAAGVPAVLAMQDQVPVNTARKFSRVFYRRLLAHGLVDLACNEARASLLTADLPGSAIPVLFSRLPDNRLILPLEGEQAATLDLQPFEPETVFIPAGPFGMGSPVETSAPEDESPQHQVDLPAYRIGKFPVTNQQYLEYVRQTGATVAPETGWKLARQGKVPDEAKLAHPITGVSWDEALGYCQWLNEQTGRRYRLPTEAEWEKAARGVEGARPYPWGDDWDPERCNNNSKDTTPVDRFGPQTPYGCFDMAGNVWEWTSTIWGSSRNDPDYRYPYQNDSREALEAAARYREYRICRGGSHADASDRLRCSARARYAADTRHKRRGFRVVMEAGEAR